MSGEVGGGFDRWGVVMVDVVAAPGWMSRVGVRHFVGGGGVIKFFSFQI